MVCDQPFVFHPAKLARKGAAVDTQIAGKPIPVEWDIHGRVGLCPALVEQIGGDPATQAFEREIVDFQAQSEVLLCQQQEHVLYEYGVEHAGIRAGAHDPVIIHPQDDGSWCWAPFFSLSYRHKVGEVFSQYLRSF